MVYVYKSLFDYSDGSFIKHMLQQFLKLGKIIVWRHSQEIRFACKSSYPPPPPPPPALSYMCVGIVEKSEKGKLMTIRVSSGRVPGGGGGWRENRGTVCCRQQ
jgi:hypothetical protein